MSLPHGAQTRQHRDLGGEGLVGNRGSRVAGTVQDKDTEEVGHALAESGQRQAGDVLVGAQGDGQEGCRSGRPASRLQWRRAVAIRMLTRPLGLAAVFS